jgi:hypothetical protein
MSNGSATGLEVGAVLVRGLAIVGKNLVPFGSLSMLLMSPPYILVLAFGFDFAAAGPNLVIAIIAIILIVILLYFLLSAALIHGTIGELRGSRARLGESVSWGLSMLMPVVSVAIVTSLGAFVGPILMIVIGMSVISNPWIVIPPAIVVGLVLFTRWWVAVAVVVVERTGVFKALRRSAELTSGSRWRVFAILIVVLIAQSVVDRAANAILSGAPSVLIVASFLITAAATAYTAVISAVCYHDLRVVKEGGDLDDIARVFD